MQKLFCVLTLFASLLSAGCCDDTCNDCDTCCEQSCDCNECNPCDCNECNPCDCNECNPCDCAECCEPCDFIRPCPPETCAYNSPVIVDIKCAWDAYATLSFLYMQAKEENLGYANAVTTPSSGASFTSSINYSSTDFDFEPAFKIGVGMDVGCDNWEGGIEYLRYHANVGNGSFSQTNSSGNYLRVWTPWGFGNNDNEWFSNIWEIRGAESTFSATSKWRLEMDILDFLLSRKYYVGKCLTFKTTAGLRAAWIDQDFNVKYTINDPVSQGINGTIIINSKNCIDSWAIGARAALGTEWSFCRSFFLFGDTGVSILYTDYTIDSNISRIYTAIGDTSPTDETFVNSTQDQYFLRPQLNLSLGLGWADYFCCNDWFFDLRIGYEFQAFWNQNVFTKGFTETSASQNTNGDLFLHGLTIAARLDF